MLGAGYLFHGHFRMFVPPAEIPPPGALMPIPAAVPERVPEHQHKTRNGSSVCIIVLTLRFFKYQSIVSLFLAVVVAMLRTRDRPEATPNIRCSLALAWGLWASASRCGAMTMMTALRFS